MQPETETPRGGGDAEPEATRTVRLTIPAKAEYITLCRLALTGLAAVRPLGEEVLADLKLALTEACSNSVRHAYADDEVGHVQVSYVLAPERIAIEVVDDGEGFDPELDELDSEGELSEGGLGIAIIRAIADDFELVSRAGVRGSRLTFAKALSG